MDEKRGSSSNLSSIEFVVQVAAESPKLVSPESLPKSDSINCNGKAESQKDGNMVQNGDTVNDGADEKMLTDEKGNLTAKKDEVKFISGDQQNGDAKIDIGALDKAFTGMTKEELMKYANDPFWVNLRWIFFIGFWAIWVLMLAGAILIIINAPKCAAPTPLVWWKQGPLLKIKSAFVNPSDLDGVIRANAKGVIYDLAPEDTYSIDKPEVTAKIKEIVENYKDTDINVILDVTANFVTKDSELLKEALEDEANRSPFIWMEQPGVPNNWRSMVNGTAWDELKPQNFVLSQFGDGKYDLHMNDTRVKESLKKNLKKMFNLGVKGFRLANAKHFIVNKNLDDEIPADDPKYIHDQYGFWTHSKTTFQEGIGSIFEEFTLFVRNISDGNAFLSVSDDTIRPEAFKTDSGAFGMDLPIYGRFINAIESKGKSKNLYNELKVTMDIVGNATWLQWICDFDTVEPLDPTAFNIFMMLLPGVPVHRAESETNLLSLMDNGTIAKQLENLRLSTTFMHGTFDLWHSDVVVAYSRFKSGNPGFFVVLNPTDQHVTANFTSVGLPEKMTFDLLSSNYNSTDAAIKNKVFSNAIPISPYAAAVLTYVPVKKD